jgi:hypothetical protein
LATPPTPRRHRNSPAPRASLTGLEALAGCDALRSDKARVEEWLRRARALATERGLSVIFEEVEQLGREHGVALR